MSSAPNDQGRGSPEAAPRPESDAKRRKIRKGTRSCWECKRRKIRCTFTTPTDTTCIGCRKRGMHCISQQYPEEVAREASSIGGRSDRRYMGDRIVRVEALIEQLTKQVDKAKRESAHPTPASQRAEGQDDDAANSSHTLPASHPLDTGTTATTGHLLQPSSSPGILTPDSLTPLTTNSSFFSSRYETIVATLLAALPPRKDIEVMMKAGINISFHTLMTQPHHMIENNPRAWATDLSNYPDVRTHPVLIAKYLLTLAACLQFVNPEIHGEALENLSGPADQLSRQFAEPAITLVNNNDDFQGCIEGLECIMLETMYQANNGNVRRAWFVCRRAMVIAQMMGLHRRGIRQQLKVLEPGKRFYPNYFWFRIIWSDRLLSLGLGLPQGSLDTSIASEAALANDTPSDRFERKQSVIVSKIIERNESSDFSTADDVTALRQLDADLQNAAAEMPSKWWLIPNLANLDGKSEVDFWETLRLVEQIMYYNLVIMLHLPYMLRPNPSTATGSTNQVPEDQYEFSKLACVNASRELLTRFIIFRSFNRVAFCCRSTDFHALVGAMTLVIGHLDGHRKQRQNGINIFAHQRNSDRAMMDQVLETMESVADLNEDVLSERSSRLLRSLLALEADAAQGKHGNTDQGSFTAAAAMAEQNPDSVVDDGQSVRIGIPYFGTIRIGREGGIAMEAPRAAGSPPLEQQLSSTRLSSPPATGVPRTKTTVRQGSDGFGVGTLPPVESSFDGVTLSCPQVTQESSGMPHLSEPEARQPFAPQFSSAINEVLQEQYLYPGLTAGADDWAFQGIDMTFFSSLLRGSGVEGAGDSTDWTNWEDVN